MNHRFDEAGWPAPVDDGACAHLFGAWLPDVELTTGRTRAVNLASLVGLSVLYLYPMSGADDSGLPPEWDSTPGARGCSPQACGFRDLHHDLLAHGATIFGVATQPPDYLAGEIERLALPYDLLSDEHLKFQRALNVPVLPVEAGGMPVFRRITLVCRDARIIKVFYPVFPPSANAGEVVRWLTREACASDQKQPA